MHPARLSAAPKGDPEPDGEINAGLSAGMNHPGGDRRGLVVGRPVLAPSVGPRFRGTAGLLLQH